MKDWSIEQLEQHIRQCNTELLFARNDMDKHYRKSIQDDRRKAIAELTKRKESECSENYSPKPGPGQS